MKKRFFVVFLFLIFTVFFSSCKSNENSTPSITSNSSTIENKSDVDKTLQSHKESEDAHINKKTSIKNVKCRLYFFNTAELRHYYIDKTLPVEDSALVTALTKELQSTSYNKDFLSLTNKVKVKSAKIDEKTGILKVVFSDSYVDHMILGTATEGGLLTSIIATYGYNLGVDKIAIYFNDELYTCLGDLPKGYFTVEYPSAEPYNP